MYTAGWEGEWKGPGWGARGGGGVEGARGVADGFTCLRQTLLCAADPRQIPDRSPADPRVSIDRRFFPPFCRRHHAMQELQPFERISLGQDMAALPSPSSPGGGEGRRPPLLLTSGDGAAVQQPKHGSSGSDSSSSKAGRESLNGEDGGALVVHAPTITAPHPLLRGGTAGGTVHLCDLPGGCHLPAPWGVNGSGKSSGSSGGGGGGPKRGGRSSGKGGGRR